MSKNYTSVFDVFNDCQGYLKVREGSNFTLANFQSLSSVRWPWIVQNWESLHKQFKEASFGDSEISSLLNDLDKAVKSYNLGNTKNNPFDSFNGFIKYSPILNLIELNTLSLSADEIIARDKEIERLSSLDIPDFQNGINFLIQQQAIVAQTIGLGDADAEKLIGLKPGKKQKSPSFADLDKIGQYGEIVKILQGYIFDLQNTSKRPPNLLAFANSNIDPESNVSITNNYLSYYTTPFEISLESMAEKYLGSKDLWYELVTVNNLKPPYIDQIGTKYDILAPGAVNNVIMSSLDIENIAVGTKVGIGSYRYREETRIIEKMTVNENGTAILYFSGAQNINRFKPEEGAYVKVYLPGTTRNGSILLIPSTTAGFDVTKPTPSTDYLRRLDRAFIQFGIDIARDEQTKDIVIDPNGNFKYTYGFNAVRDAVLNAVRTSLGELPFHADYGVNTQIGETFLGTTDEAVIFGELLRSSILSDPRFETVTIANIETTGTSISLRLLIKIQGFDSLIPLSFVA